jgi:hypothetical protein
MYYVLNHVLDVEVKLENKKEIVPPAYSLHSYFNI